MKPQEIVVLQKKTYLRYFIVNLKNIEGLYPSEEELLILKEKSKEKGEEFEEIVHRTKAIKLNSETGVMSILLENGYVLEIRYESKFVSLIKNEKKYIDYNMLYNEEDHKYEYIYTYYNEDREMYEV